MFKARCVFVLAACGVGLLAGASFAAQPDGKPPLHLRLVYLGKHYSEPTPLSFPRSGARG